MNYARLNFGSLSLVFAMGGCLLEPKSLCPQDYTEGHSNKALDCQWDFCRRNPEDARCGDAEAPDGSDDAGGGDAGGDGGDAAPGADDGQVAECIRSADCSADAPRCFDGACMPCASSTDCASHTETPACDLATGACVECTATSQAICLAGGNVCKDGSSECVQCNINDDCDESAPSCGGDNRCGTCTEDSDCARFNKVCDEGQCVQCTGMKRQGCNGFVCDSKNRVCAPGVLPESAELCQSCVSDVQCGKRGPALCLPTSFNGQDLGYFCQPKLAAGESCIGNRRPYVAAAIDSNQAALVSIDGATDASCKLRATTCQALEEFSSKSCTSPSDDDACGVVGFDDGMCVAVPAQGVHRCSVPCLSSDDCNVGSSCPPGGGACSL